MALKKTGIRFVTHRDVDLLKQLSRTGVSSSGQVLNYTNLTKNRLNNLVISGYIEKNSVIVNGSMNEVYKLGKTGKLYVKNNLNIGQLYRSNLNQISHDLKLSESYFNLDKNVQETWQNEEVLIDRFKKKLGVKRLHVCVDASVTINGQEIAIESIGRNYSEKDIAMKTQFINEHFGGRGFMF